MLVQIQRSLFLCVLRCVFILGLFLMLHQRVLVLYLVIYWFSHLSSWKVRHVWCVFWDSVELIIKNSVIRMLNLSHLSYIFHILFHSFYVFRMNNLFMCIFSRSRVNKLPWFCCVFLTSVAAQTYNSSNIVKQYFYLILAYIAKVFSNYAWRYLNHAYSSSLFEESSIG